MAQPIHRTFEIASSRHAMVERRPNASLNCFGSARHGFGVSCNADASMGSEVPGHAAERRWSRSIWISCVGWSSSSRMQRPDNSTNVWALPAACRR